MTKDNDLLKKLRDWEMWDEGDINDTREEAADRIEALLYNYEDLERRYERALQKIDEIINDLNRETSHDR